MQLLQAYIINKFMMYGHRAKYNKGANTYQAGCPICGEGKSRGKKRRLYYIPKQNFLICHNCGQTWSPINWIHTVTGLSYDEIKQESASGVFSTINEFLQPIKVRKNDYTLPEDSINLCDVQQISFYKDNQVVQDALAFIKQRRIDAAINRPTKLFLSLKDFIHKNRLIIPYIDPDNKIRFYQTRAIYPKDEERAKYLSKINSEKTVYGLNNIDTDLNYLFLFEGPIDTFFLKNALAVSGLKLTELQEQLMQRYTLYEKIWVLDNQLKNKDVKKQYERLIEENQRVFIWPKQFIKEKLKDVNEICCRFKLDSISPKLFINYSFKGAEAKRHMAQNS